MAPVMAVLSTVDRGLLVVVWSSAWSMSARRWM